MIDTTSDILAIVAARPGKQFIADLFTFALTNGTTYRFTNASRSITLGGHTYLASTAKLTRGRVKLSRGLSVDSHQLQLSEANGTMIEQILLGYFNLATYTLGRALADDAALVWKGPITRFVGQIASVDEIGQSYAKMTAKSMLNVLDNDFPRKLLQTDCPHVLFDEACGLSRASFLVSGTVAAGSTTNTVQSNLTNPDGYFAQGVVTFTSGDLVGISYMVKVSKATGVFYPAYPLLDAPAAGDTFSISPGCDKTLATCIAKYSYTPSAGTAPFFGGEPFIPDPTTVY